MLIRGLIIRFLSVYFNDFMCYEGPDTETNNKAPKEGQVQDEGVLD